MENDYYSKTYIKYLILEEVKDRDFSALSKETNANIRGLWVKCLFDLDRALKLINWNKNKQNIYVSCATLKPIPKFTFNTRKRSEETRGWYRNEYNDFIISYDIFFDFDLVDTWENLLKDVQKLKGYLDDYEVSYFVLFSGKKGIQLVVEGSYLDIKEIIGGNVFPHKTIVENIKNILNLKTLDLANCGINSRLRKVPYSLVGNNVALPLTDFQLKNFDIKKMDKDYILNNVKPLMRRGNLERNSNKKMEDKKKALKEFVDVFMFK